MTTDKASKALVGNAGEHYVAIQLSRRGYAVGLTARGIEGIDLLAANNETGKTITIQVKTMKIEARVDSPKYGLYWKWRIGKLADAQPHKNLFLAFVDLRGSPDQTSKHPDVFIVPSVKLSSLVEKFPKPPKHGPPWDNWCNIMKKDAPKYKNRWKLIEAALA
jgi:hypothetical protein